MLKKIMKAALAASLVFGMSSFAYAEDGSTIGGSFSEYFGQYNSGVEDTSGYFKPIGEANLKFKGTAGKISVYHMLETNQGANFNTTETKVSYASDFGLISIGNVVNMGTIPKGSSGFKTSNVPGSTRKALGASGYSEGHALDITIPLEGMGAVQFTYRPTGQLGAASYAEALVDAGVEADVGASSGAIFDAAKATQFPTTSEGTSFNLGASLNFDGIGVVLGYSTSKTDDPTSSDDDPLTTANMLLGVKVPFGNMAVTFDYSSGAASYDAWDDDVTITTMDLGFEMTEVGPGNLKIGYDSYDLKAGDPMKKYAGISVNYDVPVTKSSGINAGYIANTSTPEGGDAVTETYMAVGFYAAF